MAEKDNKFSILLYFILLLSISVIGQEKNIDMQKAEGLYEIDSFSLVISTYKNFNNLENKNQQAHLDLLLAKSYENLNKEDSAYFHYKKSLKEFQKLKKDDKVAEVNLEIHSLLISQKNLDTNAEIYFNAFKDYAENSDSNKWKGILNYKLAIQNFSNKDSIIPKVYFLKASDYFVEMDSTIALINVWSDLGVLFNNKFKLRDSARYYFARAYNLLESDSTIKKTENYKFNLYNNIGSSYRNEKKYYKALEYYKKSDSLQLIKYSLKRKRILYSNMVYCYDKLGELSSAYYYLNKVDSLKNKINLTKQNTLISKITEKYDNEKLRADNLEIDAKRATNKGLLIASLLLLFFGGITAILIQKNTKRKQLIAEQEREIEIQKKEKLLKDQELNTIDAMIEGQEKERQRLASDLHDSVGATLSAARLQFEHLCKYKGSGTLENEDELYTKTGKLLEQVYQEIRSMAHLKNSGVIATKGLLPAIQKLARNASTPGGLQIEVDDFGLSVKIENSLEISIFRVIQELITNIIKHSQATEATISITQHEDSLSIIVEDNGIGFDVKKSIDKDGMGLSSIEKRIEHLEGSMEVDSNIGKGTNILIDIPI